jgi:hypothetical protein
MTDSQKNRVNHETSDSVHHSISDLASCLRRINPGNFEVRIRNGTLGKYLERAYAYELVHQIRCSEHYVGFNVIPEMPKNYAGVANAIGSGIVPDILIFKSNLYQFAIEIKPAPKIRRLPSTNRLANDQQDIPNTAKDIASLKALYDHFKGSNIQYSNLVLLIYGAKNGDVPFRDYHIEMLRQHDWLTIIWHKSLLEVIDLGSGMPL